MTAGDFLSLTGVCLFENVDWCVAELHAAPALVLSILSLCMAFAVILLTGIRLIALFKTLLLQCVVVLVFLLLSNSPPLFCQSRLCSLGQCCAVVTSRVLLVEVAC